MQSPVEVYEWSVWVSNFRPRRRPTPPRIYKGAMLQLGRHQPPEPSRRRIGPTGSPSPLISVVQFFGEACRDVDVDLRIGQEGDVPRAPGRPVPSAPARLSVVQVRPVPEPARGHPRRAISPENQWAPQACDDSSDKATLPQATSRTPSCFIAYDAELAVLPSRSRSAGSPDEYTLAEPDGPTAGRRGRHRADRIGLPRRLARRAAHRGPREGRRIDRQGQEGRRRGRQGQGQEGRGSRGQEGRERRRRPSRRPRRSSRTRTPRRRRRRPPRRSCRRCRPRGTRTSRRGSTRC